MRGRRAEGLAGACRSRWRPRCPEPARLDADAMASVVPPPRAGQLHHAHEPLERPVLELAHAHAAASTTRTDARARPWSGRTCRCFASVAPPSAGLSRETGAPGRCAVDRSVFDTCGQSRRGASPAPRRNRIRRRARLCAAAGVNAQGVGSPRSSRSNSASIPRHWRSVPPAICQRLPPLVTPPRSRPGSPGAVRGRVARVRQHDA